MKPYTGAEGETVASGQVKEPQKNRMEKPQVHTTTYGTQFVDVVDLIQSEAGWAEIQQIKDANLVQPHSENGSNSSSPTHEK